MGWALWQLKKETLFRIARLGLFSASLIALLSFLELIGLFSPWPSFGSQFAWPIGNPTYYGDFMALHLPLALYFSHRSTTRPGKILSTFSFLLITLGIGLSGTRASLAGAVVAFTVGGALALICGLWSKKALVRPLVIAAGLVLLISFLPFGFRHLMPLKIRETIRSFSFENPVKSLFGARSVKYSKTVALIQERPLRGWGLGSFRFNYPIVAAREGEEEDDQFNAHTWCMHPHNEILHQAMEVGLPGLALFTLFWISLFFSGIRSLRSQNPATDRFALLAGLIGLLIPAVTWQLSTNFLFPLSRLLVGFYAAIIFHEVNFQRGKNRQIVTSIALLTVTSITLFMTAYQMSLYMTVKGQRSRSEQERVRSVELGYRLAPGAIDPLLLAVADGVNGVSIPDLQEKAALLEDQYPEVPMALYFLALNDLRLNQTDRATLHLKQALLRYPDFVAARELLSRHYGRQGLVPPP